MDPSTFWVNPFGVSFSLIKASDLILVDEEGKVIDGGPCRLLNSAAFMVSHCVELGRDEMLIIHTRFILRFTKPAPMWLPQPIVIVCMVAASAV